MHIGLSMECDHRPDLTQKQAFDEAFFLADTAEEMGFDGVWLAERHFATPRGSAGVPSRVTTRLVGVPSTGVGKWTARDRPWKSRNGWGRIRRCCKAAL